MKEVIAGLIIGGIALLFLSPWFSLWALKDIANELEKIRRLMEKENGRNH